MTKHTCTCVNPKELVSDILHTANPDDLKARLDELGLTGQYLSALSFGILLRNSNQIFGILTSKLSS